jgi:hypothetical protein
VRTRKNLAKLIGLALIAASLQAVPGSSPAMATTFTCAQGGTCVVGNVGPGGGRVFYAPGTVFTVAGAPCASTCRYLESAPLTGAYAIDNVTPYELLGQVLHNSALQETAIGSGFSNTAALLAATSSPTSAGRVASAYRGSANLSDWFLPSSLEIGAYWASNPTDATTYYMASNRLNDAIVIRNRGGDYYDFYNNKRPVLPIRAFGLAPAPIISLSQNTLTAAAGSAVTSYSITSSGGAVSLYSISPNIAATPANGISFDTSTGLVIGTPTTSASSASYTITAENGGGSTTASFSITVSAGTQTISFTPISSMISGDSKFLLATASSGLSTSYASNTPGICTVSGDKVTATSSGTCSLVASQAGNATYAAASATITFTVTSTAKNKDEEDALVLALAAVAVGVASMMADVTTLATKKKSCYRGNHTKKILSGKSCPKGYSTKKPKVLGS